MILLAFDTSTEACSVAVQVNGEVLSEHRIVQREHAALLLPMLGKLLAEFGVSAQRIDGVVFGQGPGSFTGLRIAAAAAQGLALAADCGVYGVSTLHAMASGCARLSGIAPSEAGPSGAGPSGAAQSEAGQSNSGQGDNNASADRYIMSAVDARMDQIYANTYQVENVTNAEHSIVAMAEEVVVDPDSYVWPKALTQGQLLLCGSGAERYQQVLEDTLKVNCPIKIELVANVFPHAIDLLKLADTTNPSIWKPAAEAQPVYLRNKVALTEAERSSA